MREDPESGAGRRAAATAVVAVSAFGLAACVTFLYVSAGPILQLGGFVARGGPYEIAHPAPDWSWAVGAAFMAGAFFAVVNVWAASRAGGFNLLLALWSALFAALGWAFLDAGLHPPADMEGPGVWIAIGVMFFALALSPVPLLLSGRARGTVLQPASDLEGRAARVYLAVNLAAVAAGVVAGTLIFDALSR